MPRTSDLDFNPQISQYVPLPLAEIAQTGQVLQKEYDENLLASEQFKQLMDSIQVHPMHRAAVQEQLLPYQQKLEEIAQKGDWENAGIAVRRTAMDFNKNYQTGQIGTARSVYSAYQEQNKELQKLGSKAAPWTNTWEPYAQSGGVNPDGTIKPFYFTGIGERQDHAKRGLELMANIAEDKSLSQYVIDDPTNLGRKTIKSGSSGQILEGKLKAVAASNADAFLNSIEGEDLMRKLAYENGVPYEKMSEQSKYDIATKYLTNLGYKQLHVGGIHEEDFRDYPKYKAVSATEINDNVALPNTSLFVASPNPNDDISEQLNNLSFDPTGAVTVGVPQKTGRIPGSDKGGMGYSTQMVRKTVLPNSADAELVKQVKHVQETWNFDHPKNPITLEEARTRMATASHDNSLVHPEWIRFAPDLMEEKNKEMLSTGPMQLLNNARALVLNGDQKVPASGTGLPKDFIQTLTRGKKVKASIVGRSTLNPYGIPGAYVMSVDAQVGEANRHFDVLVAAGPEEEQAYGVLGTLGKAVVNRGKASDIVPIRIDEDGTQHVYHVENIPEPDPEKPGKYKFRTVVEMMKRQLKQDPSGQWLEDETKPLLPENYGAGEFQHLRASPHDVALNEYLHGRNSMAGYRLTGDGLLTKTRPATAPAYDNEE